MSAPWRNQPMLRDRRPHGWRVAGFIFWTLVFLGVLVFFICAVKITEPKTDVYGPMFNYEKRR